MEKQRSKRKFKKRYILIVLLIIAAACGIYFADYYHADLEAMNQYEVTNPIEEIVIGDNTKAYIPEEFNAGFIFYPGGKVEAVAYEPLMLTLAEQGILSILVEMPFNLAVFDIDAADGLTEMYPQVDDWYIGGHSLGGSMAASYLAKNIDEYQGLILLGSYSTEDFSKSDIEVLSIYGSEDQVLNQEKYEENKSNLPEDFTEVEIEGGCHAYFGMYGAQDGDGEPSISNEEQIQITVKEIVKFVTGRI